MKLQFFSIKPLLTALVIYCLLSGTSAAQLRPEDSLDHDYASELPRFAPKSVAEALESFQLLEGFRIELVAAEPLVTDPIAFAFDSAGRLFVVEMRDYSEQDTERLGRLALLQDGDGDGVMDSRTTFVEDLSWPTAVWPWRDGALVAEPPKITWYRDTDGDGVSDQSEDWFTGFSRSNVQGLVNSLRWGVDGLIHGATSSAGAQIDQLAFGSEKQLELRRRDFAIDPLRKSLRPVSGGGQYGLSFNRWGDKFVTSNSDHLQQVIDLEGWLQSHPSPVPVPALRRSIAEDGPQAEVYRSSPVEPWRVVRTRLRVGGLVPGPVEGGGRASGYFTGATGTWIMDAGSGFGMGSGDVALVCDVGSNLVHRKALSDQGLFWTARRMDENTELLRSTDTWFRPVQLGDGPDGALYIADMYREVIEHPKSLHPVIKKHLDLTSGRDRGRIWRVVATRQRNSNSSSSFVLPDATRDLIELLGDSIAWRRRMAAQLLVERGVDGHEVELARQAANEAEPESQILAMHVLSRLDRFDVALAQSVLKAQHSRVLEHAIQLTRVNQIAESVSGLLEDLTSRPEPRVQLELAQLVAEVNPTLRDHLLARMMAKVREPLVRATVAITCGHAWHLFNDEWAAELDAADYGDWLRLTLPVWTRRVSADKELSDWIVHQILATTSSRQDVWLSAIANLDDRADIDRLLALLTDAQRLSLVARIEESLRADSGATHFRWLRLTPEQVIRRWVERWLEPSSSQQFQSQAIELLAEADVEQSAELLLDRFASMTPPLQSQVLRHLMARSEDTIALVRYLQAGKIRSSQIPPDIQQRLRSHSNKDISGRAQQLFEQSDPDRAKLVEQYALALDQDVTPATIDRGREHFRKSCAQCHQVAGLGTTVGAPLKQLNEKSPGQLLDAILNPNREIDPRYLSYSILLEDDRALAGILSSESGGVLTLVEAGGKTHRVSRNRIVRMKNNGISLMPVGLEQQLDPQAMQELIAFLRHTP